jgi:glycosyltransferase involved in cell wall biosynthesis
MLDAGRHRRLTRAWANRRIAAAIVVGDAGAEAMAARWRHPPRTVVVPNGVPPVPAGQRRPPQAAATPARLLFLGRLTDQKGVLDLPGIVAGLAEAGIAARLTVVGDGPLAEQLEAEAARVAPGLVVLTGFTDDPRPAFAAADLLLAPSRWEGLPFTPIEALAAGLPVLLSEIPPHHELQDGGVAVHLAPLGDQPAWVARAEAALRGLPASGAAAVAVADRRSAAQMVAATVAVYEGAIEGTAT